MIYDRQSKSFRRFLRRLTPDEIVQAALVYKCQYWHADMQKLAMKENRRKDKIEKEQWGTWEVDKAQLYMDMYDMRQQRTVSTLSTNSQVEQEDKPAEPIQDQIAAEGDFLQMSRNDKKKMIAEAKAAIREELLNQLVNHPGQSSTRWAPPNWQEAWSDNVEPGQPSYQWLPQFEGSHMQGSGAPKGTPFLGTVANIEYSMGQGWDVADMPGNTIDQKWFHFVYPHTPLRGFENHPFLIGKTTSSKAGGTLRAHYA